MKSVDFDAMFSVRPSSKANSVVVSRDDDFDLEPLPKASFGEFGDFQLVGHGEVTNEYCGKFRTFYGCPRVDLHDRITLKGESFKGKVFFKPVFYSCDKPSCPVCYIGGWAVREARSITTRLKKASKRFGQVEHIIATVPPKFYGLTLKELRAKIRKILYDRGVVGGVMIFHGFRYNLRDYWYWSPHFHVLGFILGGYKCRSCPIVKKVGKCGIENRNCDGFVNRNYRMYEKDGCIVKVKGKRKSVYHTAWYQLNHSSIKKNVKRFQVATWFGCCGYRKLKVTVEYKKSVCPICKHDLVELRYFGNNPDVLGVIRSGRRSCNKRWGYADLVEDGCRVWVEKVKRGWG